MEMEKVRGVTWVRRKCIGRGSFGAVHLAVLKSDGRVFAVKSVDLSSCAPSQAQSLENEIRVLRSVSPSPYLVQYLGDDLTRESPATLYRNLHMEYLPGGTVADMAYGDDVDERILRSYTWCVASALRYVHSKGIAHCDVKGRNVLVGTTPGTAKLSDFGSAKMIGAGGDSLPRGSPLWMAPEVIRGESQGKESDVWSLGCTLIEIVTGKPPWKDEGADTLRRIGFSDELPRFPAQLSDIGRDFLDKCLRREPSERWTCDQLLKHPFLSSSQSFPPANSITDSSPRSVLDVFDSDFSDEDEEANELSSTSYLNNFNVKNLENHETAAKRRIGELASKEGPVWESDGWMIARWNSGRSDEDEAACGRGETGEGTSSEYWKQIVSQMETEGSGSDYVEPIRDREGTEGIVSEYSDCRGDSLLVVSKCKAGSSCRHWLKQPKDLPDESGMKAEHSWCSCRLFLHLLICCNLFRFIYLSLPTFISYDWFLISTCTCERRRLKLGEYPTRMSNFEKLL